MRAILSSSNIDILRTRVFIARTIHLFNIETVAKEWGMSRITVYRYDSESYRDYSRTIRRTKKEIDDQYEAIKELKYQGLNSLEIATKLHLSLRRVNGIYPQIVLLQ